MDIVEQPVIRKYCGPVKINQEKKVDHSRRVRKYVQPPRVKSFTPNRVYCPPDNPIETKTTYHSSYYTECQMRGARPKPIKPVHNILLPEASFADDTTTKMSFPAVWGVHKARPVVPRSKIHLHGKGPMENTTTIRMSFEPKFVQKPEPILPCGSIRMGKGLIDGTTTTCLSYANPGPTEPVVSFKPKLVYCRPEVPAAQETTQKLSFVPFEVAKKENYPWAQKPVYKTPEISMPTDTTYKKSYFENKAKREKPILPRDGGVLPCGAEFYEKTIYKESFIPCRTEVVAPVLPCPNILLSDKAMEGDTTNKLSFQPVKGERRRPIMPRRRRILGDVGFMQNVTTNQLSYTPKIITRTKMILPCGNIRTTDQPLENKTTTALSFGNPGYVEPVSNYKPQLKYCNAQGGGFTHESGLSPEHSEGDTKDECVIQLAHVLRILFFNTKPEKKVEGETVNKLSYPEWVLGPKEDYPWARKPVYQKPQEKIAGDTIYHQSFPAPGYFIEESDIEVCDPSGN